MADDECVRFLQDTLPAARLRWAGFRKVRGQVCKRLRRRQRELGLDGYAAYAAYLAREPSELEIFDALCRIPISRFYRDKGVFDRLCNEIFPGLIARADRAGRETIDVWSAGCASGEEPYTLAILWERIFGAEPSAPGLRIIATDADDHMLARARAARYAAGSLKDLPPSWKQIAFDPVVSGMTDGAFVLRPEYRRAVAFEKQDIRRTMPGGPFDLILCRNLAFTYFDQAVQKTVLSGILERLRPGGFLVLGRHERLPALECGLMEVARGANIYRHGAPLHARSDTGFAERAIRQPA